jgi:PLP dependent protein
VETSGVDDGLERRLALIRRRVADAAQRAGRLSQDVTIVAVSKTVGLSVVRQAFDLGQRVFGENRVQEADAKIECWGGAPDGERPAWHLVGHLQSNKAKDAVRLFAAIHSVDSVRLAQTIDRLAVVAGKAIPILLEVNVAGETTKSGFAPQDLRSAVAEMGSLRGAVLDGLMTIAPLTHDPEEARPVFRRLRELRDDLADAHPEHPWRQLSMGMTDDFEVAIEEGATLVRIGRAIFGERRPTA